MEKDILLFDCIYKAENSRKSMIQELVVPKRCFKCGSVFDLGYDIAKEGMEFLENNEKSDSKEFLCYYCRDKEEKIEKKEKLLGEDSHWLTEEILADEDYGL
jgi:DNA-directed RNA polymerase subunit N (RpoN/RPB10)